MTPLLGNNCSMDPEKEKKRKKETLFYHLLEKKGERFEIWLLCVDQVRAIASHKNTL